MKSLWLVTRDKPETLIFKQVKLFASNTFDKAFEFDRTASIGSESVFYLVSGSELEVKTGVRYFVLSDNGKIKWWIEPMEWISTKVDDGKFVIGCKKSKLQTA